MVVTIPSNPMHFTYPSPKISPAMVIWEYILQFPDHHLLNANMWPTNCEAIHSRKKVSSVSAEVFKEDYTLDLEHQRRLVIW